MNDKKRMILLFRFCKQVINKMIRNNNTSLRRIRLAVFAFYFCQGLVFSSWASRIPDIKDTLGINDAVLGTLLLMISVGQICGMTISGLLVSRLGSKKILLFALPLYSLILLPIAVVQNEYTMIIVLLLYGVFANFMNIAVNTQGVNIETMYGKSIMSSFHGGWSIAGFTGSLIGLLMINTGMDPVKHFLIINVLSFAIFAFNWKFLSPDLKKEVSAEDKNTLKKNKPEKFLFTLGFVAFCSMIIEGTMFDWSGIYFKEVVKVPQTLVPLGFAGFMIMMATGRFMADKCNEKWGKKRVIQVCGSLAATGIFLAVIYPNLILTTIGFMIVGLGVSSIVPIVYSTAGQKTRIPTGIALTIVSSTGLLGFLSGPPVIGYISHATNLKYSYMFVGLFAVLIVILISHIRVLKNE